MKCYINTAGRLYRTKAEAPPDAQVEIVPNDQQSLIDYINARTATAAPPTEEGALIYTSPDQVPPFKNGSFMGSRHPQAIFMCVHCGRQNHNKVE